MKLIYIRKGETIEQQGNRFVVPETMLAQTNDNDKQFDEKGNEIVMYIQL